MTYKGYEGLAEFDEAAGVFSGEVINTRDVITFQGASVKELRKAFEDSVDDYLEFCAKRKEDPEKPFSGALSLRLPPEIHRRIALEARRQSKSLNSYILERLKQA
ncbi:MAG TPA: type II toxin-antitoxin system HicB family antitoxin [Bryobacteraceae bacterium]|nr:type II toxin-antitoxin system HicB family antitoxin [Bryobacteraceae bacterium]